MSQMEHLRVNRLEERLREIEHSLSVARDAVANLENVVATLRPKLSLPDKKAS